jgi:hypothetical protein
LLLTDPNRKVIATADFNGDGRADILWYSASQGETSYWLTNAIGSSSFFSSHPLLLDLNLKVIATADLDGDGKADILWYNTSNGRKEFQLSNGSFFSSRNLLLLDPNWNVTATADLNGDGKADILWYNASQGQTALWLMNGSSITSSTILVSDANLKLNLAGSVPYATMNPLQ